MITVVAISSVEDMDNANEWFSHLPSFVNKLIVRTVHKGETRKVSERNDIAFYDYGYDVFSFSEARNHALSLVNTDWCIMLDIDERLQIFKEDIELIESQPKNVAGMQVLMSTYNEYNNHIPVLATKILRNNVKYKYNCHEIVKPYIEENRLSIVQSPLFIRHLGYNTEDKKRDSLVRNYHLILRDLAENPTDTKLMFDMKRTLTGMSNANNQ